MHRWGCWLAVPVLGPSGSTCGPHPRLPREPGGMAQAILLACPPSAPPLAPVARAQGTLLCPSPASPQGWFLGVTEGGPDAHWPSPWSPSSGGQSGARGTAPDGGQAEAPGCAQRLPGPVEFPARLLSAVPPWPGLEPRLLWLRSPPLLLPPPPPPPRLQSPPALGPLPQPWGSSPIPPPQGLRCHRVGHPRPDWQACGPIAAVGRRVPTRPLFSLVHCPLNANKPGRGVGRRRRG